ncbi:SPASM domain-containing protein [Neobacillus sp. DY30]|uniref:SPASM domain-containing protein n=1 Tax=Neobacillus sp. DY30 TaxID=3047871 RepID=UPI0024BFE734|nr:SPASM domain-containing protein [Neobacillus sp. DY30]WHY00178.1 SPASM domain-containing protein [Neobacillus sp. DY30]
MSFLKRQLVPTTHPNESGFLEQNGDAYPCDFYINDEYKLGNVGEDALSDLLISPIYSEFLRLKPNLPDKCKSCKYLKLCHGGCPRNRKKDDAIQPDYFCDSYLQIYDYAHERMERLAENIKRQWLWNHLHSGHRKPDRNDYCLCGSGRKFKKCCDLLLSTKHS